MNPNTWIRAAGYGILSLSIFLIFCLAFERWLQLPPILAWGGRLHPLLLHFPIVLLLLAIALHWSGQRTRRDWLITVSVLSALFSAISGFILSLERDTKGDMLLNHQWMGAILALLATAWYSVDLLPAFNQLRRRMLMGVIAILVLSTGHTGGIITHGRDFLKIPAFESDSRRGLPDDPEIFADVIMPLLEAKCVSCHNPDKAEGELILTSYGDILAGGKSGSALNAGNETGGELLHRLLMPTEDEAHMPPAEKAQLTTQELALCVAWIHAGAPGRMRLSEMEEQSELAALINAAKSADQAERWVDFPPIEEAELDKLRNHYTGISRLSGQLNALQVRLYPHTSYRHGDLEKLRKISANIIELDLSGLPVSQPEIAFAAACPMLEELVLDRTPVNDAILAQLSGHQEIRTLRASQTRVSDISMPLLISLKNLQKLSVWGSEISEDGIRELMANRPSLQLIAGIDSAIQFSSVLPAPAIHPPLYFFRDSAWLKMSHPLAGIRILYSTDGSAPGLQSPSFGDSLLITSNIKIKYIAARDGWQPSPIDSAEICRSSLLPDRVELLRPADPKYPGSGVESLFDLKKGKANIQDSAWLGFQGYPMELLCDFNQPVHISAVRLSCLVHTAPHVFPPVRIEVWGGEQADKMHLIGYVNIQKPAKPVRASFAYYSCKTEARPVSAIRILVKSLVRLPDWHDAKGQPGWLFVDEILIDQAGVQTGAI